MSRGAFIVFEGLDRAGKSTQVSMLLQALKERSVPAQKQVFPDRTTAIGGIINDYLAKKVELPSEAVHLLFSANRWECKKDLQKTLEEGTTLIVDRYAASGAAYSCATTGRPLDWCRGPDRGLPAPDLVIFLEVSAEAQRNRPDWGGERFERDETQSEVAKSFRKLATPNWAFVDAGRTREQVHQEVLDLALKAIDACKAQPIGKLYEP